VPFCSDPSTSQIHLQKEYLSVVISLLRRWFGTSLPEQRETFTMSEKEVSLAGITAERDDDLEWFWPPRTIADVPAWDKYWNDQISHGLTPPLFDLLNNGSHLAAVMTELGMRSLLCVGNGISQEPRAFAEAGFNATALDPCAEAMRFAQSWNFSPKDSNSIWNLYRVAMADRPNSSWVTFSIPALAQARLTLSSSAVCCSCLNRNAGPSCSPRLLRG
jgi:hypothetical protein